MKCLKCGKAVEQYKCRSCGFDICAQKFSGIYKMDSESTDSISALIKSNQEPRYDGKNIGHGGITGNGVAAPNKRANDTPIKTDANKSVTTLHSVKEKRPLLVGLQILSILVDCIFTSFVLFHLLKDGITVENHTAWIFYVYYAFSIIRMIMKEKYKCDWCDWGLAATYFPGFFIFIFLPPTHLEIWEGLLCFFAAASVVCTLIRLVKKN